MSLNLILLSCMKAVVMSGVVLQVASWKCLSHESGCVGRLDLHFLLFLNPWRIIEWKQSFSPGITLVDVHLS